jgi:hypothetical protein
MATCSKYARAMKPHPKNSGLDRMAPRNNSTQTSWLVTAMDGKALFAIEFPPGEVARVMNTSLTHGDRRLVLTL